MSKCAEHSREEYTKASLKMFMGYKLSIKNDGGGQWDPPFEQLRVKLGYFVFM